MYFGIIVANHGCSLDEESLQTLMAETEAVIHSRPLAAETINEGQGFKPLSPNNLLTTKSRVVPSPGVFQRPDFHTEMEKVAVYNK